MKQQIITTVRIHKTIVGGNLQGLQIDELQTVLNIDEDLEEIQYHAKRRTVLGKDTGAPYVITRIEVVPE